MLCTSCGLCCDGSVFGQLRLDEGEEARFRRLPVLAPVLYDDYLHLPCPALSERRCTTYEMRPAGCARYRCRLLIAYEEERVDLASALTVVDQAHALAAELSAMLTPQQRALGVWRGSEERVVELAEAHDRLELRRLLRLRFDLGMLVQDELLGRPLSGRR
jgi:hypothetical protein